MKLEDLVVGEKYLNSSNNESVVLFVSSKNVLWAYNNESTECEYISSLDFVLESWKPIIRKRELIELFPCLVDFGDFLYLNKNNQNPMFSHKNFGSPFVEAKRVKHLPSIFIDAETFEIVEWECE
jgi:hypothetical protein